MKNRRKSSCSADAAEGTFVRSSDGAIAFKLARTAVGVLVERHQFRRGGGRVVVSSLFVDAASFDRWCDADSVKFDYPLVHQSVRRNGNALLNDGA